MIFSLKILQKIVSVTFLTAAGYTRRGIYTPPSKRSGKKLSKCYQNADYQQIKVLSKSRLLAISMLSQHFTKSTLLPTFAYFCVLLHTFAYFCIILRTFVYFCIILHTFAHFCAFSQLLAHFLILSPLMAHFCTFSQLLAHFAIVSQLVAHLAKFSQLVISW